MLSGSYPPTVPIRHPVGASASDTCRRMHSKNVASLRLMGRMGLTPGGVSKRKYIPLMRMPEDAGTGRLHFWYTLYVFQLHVNMCRVPSDIIDHDQRQDICVGTTDIMNTVFDIIVFGTGPRFPAPNPDSKILSKESQQDGGNQGA